jgi:hypothetical protein
VRLNEPEGLYQDFITLSTLSRGLTMEEIAEYEERVSIKNVGKGTYTVKINIPNADLGKVMARQIVKAWGFDHPKSMLAVLLLSLDTGFSDN